MAVVWNIPQIDTIDGGVWCYVDPRIHALVWMKSIISPQHNLITAFFVDRYQVVWLSIDDGVEARKSGLSAYGAG